jgi:hypothetical protein
MRTTKKTREFPTTETNTILTDEFMPSRPMPLVTNSRSDVRSMTSRFVESTNDGVGASGRFGTKQGHRSKHGVFADRYAANISPARVCVTKTTSRCTTLDVPQ